MLLKDIDFTDLDNFADGFPHHLFDIHRREAPVYWHEPTENTPDGEASGRWPPIRKPLPCFEMRTRIRR
jgi:hypothetical protein